MKNDMTFLNSRWLKYVILIPFIFMILNAVYNINATNEIENVLMNEKYGDLVACVDMLSAEVGDNVKNEAGYSYDDRVLTVLKYLGTVKNTYSTAYILKDGQLELLSEKYGEREPFSPRNYPELMEAAKFRENGHLIMAYTSEEGSRQEMQMYFRWMPDKTSIKDDEYPARVLLVAAVSNHSFADIVNLWVSVGQWAGMGLTLIINIWMVTLIARLGYIFDQRRGDKWRDERRG